MVQCNHAVVLRERSVAVEPIEVGGCCPPMQQHKDRCTIRPGDVAIKRGSASGQFDVMPVGQWGDAETYLIGHIEEKTDGVEIMSPSSPIGSALLGHGEGDKVNITLENGAKVSVQVVKVNH